MSDAMLSITGNQKRSAYIDNVKAVLIFSVIVGHLIETSLTGEMDAASVIVTGNSFADVKGIVDESALAEIMGNAGHLCKSAFCFIYSFHMPAFVFISGCLSEKVLQNKERTFAKAYYYYALYILMDMLCKIVRFGFGEELSYSLFSEGSVPWYVFALANFYLITYILRKFDRSFLLIFSILLSLFVGYDDSIGDFFALSRTIVFYPFFLLGTMVNIEQLKKKLYSQPVRIASILYLIIYVLLCWFKVDLVYVLRPLFTARNSFSALDELSVYGGLLRLLAYCVSIASMASVLSLIPDRRCVLSKMGMRTLPIYFFHRPIIYMLTGSGVYLGLQKYLGVGRMRTCIVWLSLSIPIFYVLSLGIFEKPFNLLSRYCGLDRSNVHKGKK